MIRITVLGSVNLDLVATAPHLPAPGETVTGATLARHPGGKGANQALAARRLGADVALVARFGADGHAEEALALLRAEGVDLSACVADSSAPTGVALIAVGACGENQIVVASGANATLTPACLPALSGDALICQLELPVETVAAAMGFAGFVCVNLAPAAEVVDAIFERADLIVVNDGEAAFYGARLDAARGIVAVTHGARGATLKHRGAVVAEAAPPPVAAVDTTGAGDAFVAALTIELLNLTRHTGESRDPARPSDWVPAFAGMTVALNDALAFACAAGAVAATTAGAQPSLPTRAAVEARLKDIA